MNPIIDFLAFINQRVLEFFYAAGFKPAVLILSPSAYRRFVEQMACWQPEGKIAASSSDLTELPTPGGKIRVEIDESLPDFQVGFAPL